MPYSEICHRYFYYEELERDPRALEMVERYWLDVFEKLSMTHEEAISTAQEHELYVFERKSLFSHDYEVLYFESVYEACVHYNCLWDAPSKSTGKRQGRVANLFKCLRGQKIVKVWKPSRTINVNGNDAKYWQPQTREEKSALLRVKKATGEVRHWANQTLQQMHQRIERKNEIRREQGLDDLLPPPEWDRDEGGDSFRAYVVRYLKAWAVGANRIIPRCATSKRIFTSVNQLSMERILNDRTYHSTNLFMVWRHFNMMSGQCHFDRETFELIKALRNKETDKLPFEYVAPVEGKPLSKKVRDALRSLLANAQGSIDKRNKVRKRQGRRRLGPVRLTYKQLEDLWRELRGLCYYSKIPMDPQRGDDVKFKVSLERIDDDDTYWIGNVKLVCHEFNTWQGEYMDAKKWSQELAKKLAQIFYGTTRAVSRLQNIFYKYWLDSLLGEHNY